MAQVTTMPSAAPPVEAGRRLVPVRAGSGALRNADARRAHPVETITYNINPQAVWSDGVKITCDDFKYTWEQIAKGTNIYDPTGYTGIANVDCTNEAQPVVTYKAGQTYSGWQQLFGSAYGIMPSHILSKGDRDTEMKNGYDWSGGPWFAKWTKGDNITLTPNPKYWGPPSTLDKVELKFFADTAAEFQAFKAGEVDVIGPQPQLDGSTPSMPAVCPPARSVASAVTGTSRRCGSRTAKAPFDDKIVRQAFAYSIDRDAIVNKLFGGIGVTKAVNCLNPPILAEFSDQDAFAGYKLDLAKEDSLLTGDGWAKGSDGILRRRAARSCRSSSRRPRATSVVELTARGAPAAAEDGTAST